MTSPKLESFWQKLNTGPSILFLGQQHLCIETDSDPLLAQITTKYGGVNNTKGYDQILDGLAHQDGDSALAWMSERARLLSAPTWLERVADFAWNGVFSSAIDTIWMSAFRSPWREVAPIFSDEYFPRHPRSRRELNCTFLFGSINQVERANQPPLQRLDHLRRQQTARNLAQRIPDMVTPLGILVIDAYDCKSDWFNISEFYPVLRDLSAGQVHYFGLDEASARLHPILADLVDSNIVTLHECTLEWALDQGNSRGLIGLGERSEWHGGARVITIGKRSVSMPRDLWNRVGQSATILDEDVLMEPPTLSSEAQYWEFRRFLYESGSRPLWSGLARGLAFRRDFEDVLVRRVRSRLQRGSFDDAPIVVHGQTGTGKTVALGSLAYGIALDRTFPTLFIERGIRQPTYPDVDQCCQWFEDHEADAVLVVWDGMRPDTDYDDLQAYLASRGRKAVVVGSCYKLSGSRPSLITVPDRLTASEAGRFGNFLRGLGITVTERHSRLLASRDSHYLVALYRLLPPTRPRITSGVIQELDMLETELIRAVDKVVVEEGQPSALAMAFLSAGLIDTSKLDEIYGPSDQSIGLEEVTDLVETIMVPAQFGLSIPIELLARACGNANLANLAHILGGFDLIDSFEDPSGNVVVGARHRLEASLIVRARVGGAQAESRIIGRVVEAMRPISWPEENEELAFVIDLLQAVGPSGEERGRFAGTFLDLARTLKRIREVRGIQNPRLMLQEANLLREWVQYQSSQHSRPEGVRTILEEARAILSSALEVLDDDGRNRRLRMIVATELASLFGTLTVDSINAPDRGSSTISAEYTQLRAAVDTVRALDADAYRPVDVLAWSTQRVAEAGVLTESARADAIVELLDALENLDQSSLEAHNRERLVQWKYTSYRLLGEEALSEAAFAELRSMGSGSGFYIRALEIAGRRASSGGLPRFDSSRQEMEMAWQYLEDHRREIARDVRCMNLLFTFWFESKVGFSFFEHERVTLSFDRTDWVYALSLIRDLRELGSHRDITLAYFEAICMFHLDFTGQCLQLFTEIESQSDVVRGMRRILKFFVAANSDGRPMTFHGNVQNVASDTRIGRVFVEEISASIPFIPREFRRPQIRRGDSLGEFHIAFNFLGLIADPTVRSRN